MMETDDLFHNELMDVITQLQGLAMKLNGLIYVSAVRDAVSAQKAMKANLFAAPDKRPIGRPKKRPVGRPRKA